MFRLPTLTNGRVVGNPEVMLSPEETGLPYAFEREWRSIRMLHRLERVADSVLSFAKTPADVKSTAYGNVCGLDLI